MTFDDELQIKKKRVGKACDSCRLKKTKCDGKKPCNRCILDNKICIFTDKKKLYQKTYPLGYVELLETRLNLLTKSLELLIQKDSTLQGKINNDDDNTDDDTDDDNTGANLLPINKVVLYLIKHDNLINSPTDWEQGTLIAANLDDGNRRASIEKFANYKYQEDLEEDTTSIKSNESMTIESPTKLRSPEKKVVKSPEFIRSCSNHIHKPRVTIKDKPIKTFENLLLESPIQQYENPIKVEMPDSLFKREPIEDQFYPEFNMFDNQPMGYGQFVFQPMDQLLLVFETNFFDEN